MFKRLFACALVASSMLTACLFDDEDKDSDGDKLTLSGALAELDTLPSATPDSGGPTYQVWFLPVDSSDFEQLQEGSCFYTGYLGDSAHTDYTNPLMAGQKTAQLIRSEGLELYRDTAQVRYTHYRVEFDCFD